MNIKILSYCVVLLLLVSCQSKEEKAAKLIKEDMYKTLYDFSSYEPVETIVDSAFTSIYRDSVILGYAYLSREYLDKANEYIEQTKEAQSSMEIWSDSYSSYGYSKYKNAKSEFESNLEKAKDYLSKINVLQKSIKEKASEFQPSFCGWQAKHKFRCKTKGGNFDLGNYLYIFGPDFKKIIYSEDLDNEKLLKVKKLIDEVLEEEEEDK